MKFDPSAVMNPSPTNLRPLASKLWNKTFFNSGYAIKKFMKKGSDIEEVLDVEATVLAAIRARMDRLESGINEWWMDVENGKESHTELMSAYVLDSVRTKCKYLLIALKEEIYG